MATDPVTKLIEETLARSAELRRKNELVDNLALDPFVTPKTLYDNPFLAYQHLQQSGMLPQNYPMFPNAIAESYPTLGYFVDEDGRTQYELPTTGQAPLESVTPEMIQNFLESQRTDGLAASTAEPIPYENPWQKEIRENADRWAVEDELQQTLARDFEQVQKVTEGMDPDNVRNLRSIASMALRLLQAKNEDGSDNKEAIELAQVILHTFKDYEPFHTVFDKETNDTTLFRDVYEPPKQPPAWKRLVAYAFDKLDAPLQTVLASVADFRTGDYDSGFARLGKGGLNAAGELGDIGTYMAMPPLAVAKIAGADNIPIAGAIVDPVSAVTDRFENMIDDTGVISDAALYDVNKDGRLDFFEGFGINPEWGKDWGWRGLNVNTGANIFGEFFFDPVTYTTFGVGGLAKSGIKTTLRVVNSFSKKQLANVFISLGDDAVKAGLKTTRAYEIAANLSNKVPWKKFAQEGDEEILATLLRVGRVSDDVATPLNKGAMNLQSILDESTKRQSRKINRATQRIVQRSGGGVYMASPFPSIRRGASTGLATVRLPFTRGLYQASLKAGASKQSWSYFKQLVPKLLKTTYPGVTALKHLSADFGTALDVFNTLNAKIPRIKKVDADGVVAIIPDPKFVINQQSLDTLEVFTGLPLAKQTPEGVQRTLGLLEEAEVLVKDIDTGAYKLHADAAVNISNLEKSISSIKVAEDLGLETMDDWVVRMNDDAAEWTGITEFDELEGIAKTTSAGPENFLAKANNAIYRKTGVNKLINEVNKFRTFAKASRMGTEELRDSLKFISAKSKRMGTLRLQSIEEVMKAHYLHFVDPKKGILVTRLGLTPTKAKQILDRIVDHVRSSGNRTEAISTLKTMDDMPLIPPDIWDEIDAFIKNIDQLAEEYFELQKVVGSEDFSSIDPMRYIPQKVSKETQSTMKRWLSEGGRAGKQTLNDLSTEEGVRRFLDESAEFQKAKKQHGITEEVAAPAIASMFRHFNSEADRIAAQTSAFAALGEGDVLERLFKSDSSMQTRTVLPEVLSVIETNTIISDLIKIAAKHRGLSESFYVTHFYDIDPVDQWIRYSREASDKFLMLDFIGDLQELKIFDLPVPGSNQTAPRPAAIIGDVRKTKNVAGELVYEYEFLDPFSIARSGRPETKTLIVKGEKELEKVISNTEGIDQYYITHRVGDSVHLVDKEIYAVIEKDILPAIKSGYTQNSLVNMFNTLETTFGAWATVPFIGGTGFHARNNVSNWFNMTLAGMRNPKFLTDALELQHMNKAVHHFMQKEFILNYSDALDELVKRGSYQGDFERAARFTPEKAKRLKEMNYSGILDQSFFADLKKDMDMFRRRGKGKDSLLRRKLLDNPVIRSGQALASFLENNARIALYLDGVYSKGLGKMESATRVREFLFDYGDLTGAELMAKNTVSRFYTWMRKNTALQARVLATSPGSLVNTQKAVEAVVQGVLGDSKDWDYQPFMPDWIDDSGWAIGAKGLSAARYETPLISALETVEKATYVPALFPGIANVMPEWVPDSRDENIRGILGLLAGGSISLVNYTYEELFGRSTFTGGPIQSEGFTPVVRFLGAVMPAVTKSISLFEKYGALDFFEDRFDVDLGISLVADHQQIRKEMDTELTATDRLLLNAFNIFAGMNTYQLDTDQQMRLLAGWETQWEKIVTELKREGVSIPSLSELREAGIYQEANQTARIMMYAEDPIASGYRATSGEAKLVLEEYGYDPRKLANEAKTEEEKWDNVFQQIQIVDFLINADIQQGQTRRILEPHQILGIALEHPSFGFVNDELEFAGLQGFYGNKFEEENTADENLEAAMASLEYLFAKLDIPLEQAQAIRPRMTEIERIWRDGAEQGMSTPEIWLYIVEDLSARARVTILGEESYDKWAINKGPTTEEEVREMNEKVYEEVFLYQSLAMAMGVRPTTEDIIFFLANGTSQLTQSQRERLGIPLMPVLSTREDARTPEMIMTQDLITEQALLGQAASPGYQLPSDLASVPQTSPQGPSLSLNQQIMNQIQSPLNVDFNPVTAQMVPPSLAGGTPWQSLFPELNK